MVCSYTSKIQIMALAHAGGSFRGTSVYGTDKRGLVPATEVPADIPVQASRSRRKGKGDKNRPKVAGQIDPERASQGCNYSAIDRFVDLSGRADDLDESHVADGSEGSLSKVAQRKKGGQEAAYASAEASSTQGQKRQNQAVISQLQQLLQQLMQIQGQVIAMLRELMQQDLADQPKKNDSRVIDETNVYVAHLPPSMTGEEFARLMGRFGTVLSSRLIIGDHYLKKNIKNIGFAR
jgi:hypothetical protein